MKQVKIILIVISIIGLGFFSTGFIIKEVSYTNAIGINKPIDMVFDELTKVENFKDWMPEVKSVSTRKKTPNHIGSIYDLEVVSNDHPISVIQKIVAFESPTKFSVSFRANDMDKTNVFLLTKEGVNTTLVLESTCSTDSYALSCILPYFKSVFKDQDAASLQLFKAYLERK